MVPLEQVLQPLLLGHAETTEATAASGSWKGRTINPAPLLHGKIKPDEAVTGQTVAQALAKKYGRFIGDHFSIQLQNTKLSQREVRQLDAAASSLLRDIQRHNRQLTDHLLNDGLAQQVFEYEFGYDWHSLCQEERQHFVEQLRLSLSESMVFLDGETIREIALKLACDHKWLYSSQVSRTTEYLLKQLPDESTVLPGFLRLWAAGHYEPGATPGGLLPEGSVFAGEPALSERDVRLLTNADHFSRVSARLLSDSPIEKLEYQSYEEQLDEAHKLARSQVKLLSFLSSPGHHIPAELNNAIKSDLMQQLGKIIELISELELDIAEDPLGEEGWKSFKENEVISAMKLLDAVYQVEKDRAKPEKIHKMSQLKSDYKKHLDNIRAGTDGNIPPASSQARKVTNRWPEKVVTAVDYSKRIESQLKEVLGQGAVDRMEAVRGRHMSSIQWQPLVNRFDVRVQGRVNHYESKQRPASQMKMGDGQYDIFDKQYKGAGRSSTQKQERQHAVNLGETSLSKLEGGKRRVLYRGLRSGAVSAFDIKDKAERKEATLNRAVELVTAATKQYLDDNPSHPMDQPIPLRILSVSLLSPDKARHVTGYHDDELKMQEEQVAALKEVERQLRAGQPLVMTDEKGNRHDLKVNLQVINTSYGVNKVSLSGWQKINRAWTAADKVNNEGLVALIGSATPYDVIGGWAGEFLASDASEKEKRIVQSLVEQIRDLQASGDYRKEGEDAYKMVERLQLLAFKLGVKGHFNCTNGKDRSGETDASIKRFAAEVDALGYVPDPRKPLTHEDQYLTQAFTFNTGNLELQQMNINLPGYKTQVGKKRLGQYVFNQAHQPRFHI